MKGRIIPLRSDEHQELWDLLPWYVTGQLDRDERARVDTHLAGCAECQAELRLQRRLETEVAGLPLDVEQGWSRMQARMAQAPRGGGGRFGRLRPQAAWLGWGVAAVLALFVGVSMLPQERAADYRTLSAAPPARVGNVVVIFRPETTEAQMRGALQASDARLVDGPTATDGYVLLVPDARRPGVLAALRARPEVVLAEPLDPAS